jgi:hypothetical protein
MSTITYDVWVFDGTGQRVRQTVTEQVPDPTVDQLNLADLKSKAGNAISGNITALGVANPTNAQVVAQVKALTRQNNALIRIVLGLLDTTDGT